MTAEDRRLVQEVIACARARGALDMDAVLDRLFALSPEMRALFIGDMGRRMRRFWEAMERVAWDGPEAEAAQLRGLGALHAGAGVEDADHAAFCAALVDTLARALGEDWTTEREAALRRVYRETAMAMSGVVVGGERLELPTSSV